MDIWGFGEFMEVRFGKWLNYWSVCLTFHQMSGKKNEKTRQRCDYFISLKRKNNKIIYLPLYHSLSLSFYPSSMSGDFRPRRKKFIISNKFCRKYKFVLRPLSVERNCFWLSGWNYGFSLMLALVFAGAMFFFYLPLCTCETIYAASISETIISYNKIH